MVELAILTPLLFLIIFGIIEFGWAFYQDLDVRHGARETARLVAVNYKQTPADIGATQTLSIVAAACDRMDAPSNTSVSMSRSGDAIGQTATVTISKPLDQLTGYLGFALNGKTLTSSVKIRLEQAATWTPVSGQPCP
jgi:Flp pilus assembly protein TadG